MICIIIDKIVTARGDLISRERRVLFYGVTFINVYDVALDYNYNLQDNNTKTERGGKEIFLSLSFFFVFGRSNLRRLKEWEDGHRNTRKRRYW